MTIRTAEFKTSAPGLDQCPDWQLPEFAFIGRSNVGKSSLVNVLAGRRELALVSNTPGKTKLLNFFVINGRWSLVDLPGYGYARVEKQVSAGFNQAVALYLARRTNLAHVFVLIDSRLPPQAIDLEFLEWLGQTAAPHSLVFTKADKQSPTATRANIAVFMAQLARMRSSPPETFVTSSKTNSGRAEILGHIAAILAD
ncbi:MAG: YihA family ribosome biogenesis GTP-binding protein [Verrucomicrobia bacterium]|nr:YihA family ribosome biogenesis GTP-binding protein [Verrucomicrobiota bacterium]